MNLVTVYKTFSSADAQLIRSMLEAAEVPATVTHEIYGIYNPVASGGIAVQVPEDQVELARELITTSVPPAE